MSKIIIWGRKSSSNVQSVLWCLEELGLSYQRIDAGFNYGVVDTPEFLAMNPNGKVPVIIDGNAVSIFESGAILRYLANQYGTVPFWPEANAARALIDQWAEWAKINFANAFTTNVFWPLIRTPPSKRDYKAVVAALAAIEVQLAIADRVLSKTGYLAGDEFSLADIQFGHCLHRYYDINLKRIDLPHLRAYFDVLQERSSFGKHVMVSYDELRVDEG